MRILVLSDTFPPFNLGGAGEVADMVAGGLAGRGHEVRVLTATAQRRDAGTEVRDGVTVRRLWVPVPAPLRLHLSVVHPWAAALVACEARAFRPDAVHAHNVHERLSFASLSAARAGGGRVLLTAHDYLLFCLTKFLCARGDVAYTTHPTACPHCRHMRRVPARNVLVHRLVRRNVGRIACISAAQQTALRANGFAGVPQEVVYNGIDARSCAAEPGAAAQFRRRTGVGDRPMVLFGGRISGAKGGDQLLRAMAVARRRVDCRLVILGDRQAYFEHALRLAAQVGLDREALVIGGWLENGELHAAFAAADVCATPSVYPDPFNLMTIRAMAHGKPVVGTRYGGTPEIVVDGQTGFVADPWDPEQFGARIADLLTDRTMAERMGAAGRVRVTEHFTLDRQIAAYERLLAAPDGPR
jgi:glycosyltransferase involved in cell wall biosynthesis